MKFKNSLKTEDFVVDETQELNRVVDGSKADGLHENRGMVQDETQELYKHLPTSGSQNTVKNLLYPPFIYIF